MPHGLPCGFFILNIIQFLVILCCKSEIFAIIHSSKFNYILAKIGDNAIYKKNI